MTAIKIGPIAYRPFTLEKACQESVGHKHNYDHTTIFGVGKAEVIAHQESPTGELVEVGRKTFVAGQKVAIPKNLHHTIKALDSRVLTDAERAMVAEIAGGSPSQDTIGKALELLLRLVPMVDHGVTQYDCIYAHRDWGGLVIESNIGNEAAYQ